VHPVGVARIAPALRRDTRRCVRLACCHDTVEDTSAVRDRGGSAIASGEEIAQILRRPCTKRPGFTFPVHTTRRRPEELPQYGMVAMSHGRWRVHPDQARRPPGGTTCRRSRRFPKPEAVWRRARETLEISRRRRPRPWGIHAISWEPRGPRVRDTFTRAIPGDQGPVAPATSRTARATWGAEARRIPVPLEPWPSSASKPQIAGAKLFIRLIRKMTKEGVGESTRSTNLTASAGDRRSLKDLPT